MSHPVVPLRTTDGVATIPVAELSPHTLSELESCLDIVRRTSAIELLVVEVESPATPDADFDTALLAQRVLTRLATLPIPTVALLPDGPCVGPGLELALACDYRLAVAGPDADIGFPDGPCWWGGVTRLTRRVGPRAALDLLLNRTELDIRSAAKTGIVDRAYCTRRANIEPLTFLDRLRDRPKKQGGGRCPLRLEAWAAARFAAEMLDDTDPFGPAVVRVVTAAARSLADGLAEERRVADVVGRRVKTVPKVVTANPVGPPPTVIGTVGTAGFLADWMTAAAVRGATVVSRNVLEATASLAAWRDRLTPLEADAAASRLTVGNRFDRAGLIVVTDATDIRTVEAVAPPRAVIAVVGRSVLEAQATADRPGRVLGFAPPLRASKLVEVVRGRDTTPDATAFACRWLAHIGRQPVVVSDRPNQIVRRVTAAFWDEAIRLVAEGTPADVVDRIAARVGRRPLAELDDYGHSDANGLVPRLTPLVATGEPFYLMSRGRPWANEAAQLLLWDARQLKALARGKVASAVPPDTHQTAERLLLRVVVTAAACLADDDFAGPADVDFAVVKGCGLFAASGGPLRYADEAGLGDVVTRLRHLAGWCGKRFGPPAELTRRMRAGEGFYSAGEGSPLRVAA